jgi:HEAT repeat protein
MYRLLMLANAFPFKPLQLTATFAVLALSSSASPTVAQTAERSIVLPRSVTQLIAQASNRDLLERLRTADGNERSEIIQVLKQRGKAAIPELIQALEITDPLVRTGAAAALGQLGEASSAAVPALLKLLEDDRRALFASTRSSYYTSPILEPLLDPPVPPIYAAPNPFAPPGIAKAEPIYELRKREIPTPPENPQKRVKIQALAAIGQIGGVARSAATQPVAALLRDADPWVQLNAAWCLGQIGSDVPVLSIYLTALQSPDPLVSSGAAQLMRQNQNLILKTIGTEANATTAIQFVKVLGQPNANTRDLAVTGLTNIGAAAIPALTNGLRDPNPLIRLESATALQKFGPAATPAVPELLRLLKDPGQHTPPPRNPNEIALPTSGTYAYDEVQVPGNPDRLVRIAALQTIGMLQPNLALADRQLVSGLLTDRDTWVRLNALWTTQRLGISQDQTAIYTELLRDERTQSAALSLLSRDSRLASRPQPELMREIVQSLASEDPSVRSMATNLLLQIKATALPELSTALNHANPLVRAEAAATIGQIGPTAQATVPALIRLVQDQGQYIPVQTDPYGIYAAPLPAITRSYYGYGYGSRAAQPLVYSVRPPTDRRTLVRSQAIIALGMIHHPDPAAIQALQDRVAQDPDQWVKLQSVWALLQLGIDGASLYPVAKNLINSDDVAIQSATTDLLPFLGRKAQGEMIKRYAARLDDPKNRVNTVLQIDSQNLGATTVIPLVPLLRPYLTGDDAVLRGYTVTILANLADRVIRGAESGQLTQKQQQQALTEFSQVVMAIEKSGAKFNVQPVQRLRNSVTRLQQGK